MSRTYKDKPHRVKYPDHTLSRYHPDSELRGIITKKPKYKDTEWHWMSTPSWWNRLFNNVPMRRKGRVWERNIQKSMVQSIEDTDPPSVSKKPHKYYW